MLRNPSSKIHLLSRDHAKLNAELAPRIAELKYRIVNLISLFKLLSPIIFYAGHDCYAKAIDFNVALRERQSALLLPKGKLFHAYNWPVRRNGSMARHRSGIYESHLYRQFKSVSLSMRKKVPTQLIRASAKQLKKRLKNVNTLCF